MPARALCLKPLVFYNAIKRHARKKDRGLLYICLILRVVAVIFVLTEFESACTAEHYIYDSDISDCSDYPLPCCAACTEAYYE